MARDDDVREVPMEERDEEVFEEWQRTVGDPDIGGVCAIKVGTTGWTWQVSFGILEFLREGPLLDDLLASIHHELSAVDGVTQVVHEDREVFIVAGTPAGAALVRAAGSAVDGLTDRLREHYEGLVARSMVLDERPKYTEAEKEILRARRDQNRRAIDDAMSQLGFRELSPDEVARFRKRGGPGRPSE